MYEDIKRKWDEIFSKKVGVKTESKNIGIIEIDNGLDWLCKDTSSILDFGCGTGKLLFSCNKRGTKKHFGIDISEEGIRVAKEQQSQAEDGEYHFEIGGIEKLELISNDSVDAVILSNILDNLIPSDCLHVVDEVNRILKKGGKVFIKLNSYVTAEQIKELGIKRINDNFLDDGLYLWNKTTTEWTSLFEKYFKIIDYSDIYFEEHDQYNRLFLLINSNKVQY